MLHCFVDLTLVRIHTALLWRRKEYNGPKKNIYLYLNHNCVGSSFVFPRNLPNLRNTAIRSCTREKQNSLAPTVGRNPRLKHASGNRQQASCVCLPRQRLAYTSLPCEQRVDCQTQMSATPTVCKPSQEVQTLPVCLRDRQSSRENNNPSHRLRVSRTPTDFP
ncbi:unnamed protein product [Ectocarpus sp. 12 AP-2014]